MTHLVSLPITPSPSVPSAPTLGLPGHMFMICWQCLCKIQLIQYFYFKIISNYWLFFLKCDLQCSSWPLRILGIIVHWSWFCVITSTHDQNVSLPRRELYMICIITENEIFYLHSICKNAFRIERFEHSLAVRNWNTETIIDLIY